MVKILIVFTILDPAANNKNYDRGRMIGIFKSSGSTRYVIK